MQPLKITAIAVLLLLSSHLATIAGATPIHHFNRPAPQLASTQRSRLNCQRSKPVSKKGRQAMQNQGIEGKVVRLVGDHMPPASGMAVPVSTEVWVFKGKISGRSPQWSIAEARNHPQRLTCIQSDQAGQFFVSLEPGEYTLFARYDSYLYLNSFAGNGHYGSVIVSPQRMTPVQLINSQDATF